MRSMVGAYNGVLEVGSVRQDWKISKMVMIPKVKKPQAMQHRAVTLSLWGWLRTC